VNPSPSEEGFCLVAERLFLDHELMSSLLTSYFRRMPFGFSNIRIGLNEPNWHLACFTRDQPTSRSCLVSVTRILARPTN